MVGTVVVTDVREVVVCRVDVVDPTVEVVVSSMEVGVVVVFDARFVWGLSASW